VPARLSPPPLSAYGQRATAAGFEQMGLRPGLPLALLSGGGELGGGFLIAAGLVTPLGTALLAAVMTVAILVVHLRRGIWGRGRRVRVSALDADVPRHFGGIATIVSVSDYVSTFLRRRG